MSYVTAPTKPLNDRIAAALLAAGNAQQTANEGVANAAAAQATANSKMTQATGDGRYFRTAHVYDSGELTPVAQGNAYLTHGLPGDPKKITCTLVCRSPEHGFGNGNEIQINNSLQTAANASYGHVVQLNIGSTRIWVQYGYYAQWQIPHASNGSVVTTTAGSWRLRIRAWY
jgi:hypothetical protein